MAKFGFRISFDRSTPESQIELRRSRSMNGRTDVKRSWAVVPPYILAEDIPKLSEIGLRWSNPGTPSEMLYAEEYVAARHPQYRNGLIDESVSTEISPLSIHDESVETGTDKHKSTNQSPRSVASLAFGRDLLSQNKIILEPSKLLDILKKKFSLPGSFKSVPEILAQMHILRQFELTEDEYLVIFTPSYKDSMFLIGESYPFDRHNCYMTAIDFHTDYIKEFAGLKQSKVIKLPNSWFDLRIKGSQLSHYFRRKNKHSPNRLFAFPANVVGTRYTLHWVSEAQRYSWHVLLDAALMGEGEERLNLELHRPDFLVCDFFDTTFHPCKISCLLVRRNSFDTSSPLLR